MNINIKELPDFHSLKFVIEGFELGFNDPVLFKKTEERDFPGFVRNLFQIECIESVVLGSNFFLVSKTADSDLNELKEKVLDFIKFLNKDSLKVKQHLNDLETEILSQIKSVIEENIKPSLKEDGGDIEFISYFDGIVTVKLCGACADCPYSDITLKQGVENILRYYVPEIKEVRSL